MDITKIGARIAVLRREKGATQEDLAKRVGVTAQAVSKWENGGAPDTELLPAIADYFETSIDSLFGKNTVDGKLLDDAIENAVYSEDRDQLLRNIFEFCWKMEQCTRMNRDHATLYTLDQTSDGFHEDTPIYSSLLFDGGFTQMLLTNGNKYFICVPENPDANKLTEGVDLAGLFSDLAKREVLDTLIMLYKRDLMGNFTRELIQKRMGFDEQKTDEVLSVLRKYHILGMDSLELNDETINTYWIQRTPAVCFVSLLIFAHDLANKPGVFFEYCDGKSKAFLK